MLDTPSSGWHSDAPHHQPGNLLKERIGEGRVRALMPDDACVIGRAGRPEQQLTEKLVHRSGVHAAHGDRIARFAIFNLEALIEERHLPQCSQCALQRGPIRGAI